MANIQDITKIEAISSVPSESMNFYIEDGGKIYRASLSQIKTLLSISENAETEA